MKAVIVEIRKNKAAALSADGRINIVKNRSYVIGQEIAMNDNKKYIKWVVSAAAALMIFATPAWAYFSPYSYVSVDVNPSIEFSLNRFDRVLKVKAVNDDGEEIVKEIDLENVENSNIKEALKKVLIALKNKGYISEDDDGGVVVATFSKTQKKTDELTKSIKSTVEEEVNSEVESETTDEEVDSNDINEENDSNVEEDVEEDIKEKKIEVEVVGVGRERVEEARKIGITPGKLNLIQKLQEAAGNPEDFDINKWKDASVKEIMKEVKYYKKLAKLVIIEEIDEEGTEEVTNKEAATGKNGKTVATEKEANKNNNVKKSDLTKNIEDLKGVITSVDKKNNKITIKLSHDNRKMEIYLNEDTEIKGNKGKNIKVNQLKVNDKVKLNLKYINNQPYAENIEITNTKTTPSVNNIKTNNKNNENKGNNASNVKKGNYNNSNSKNNKK